MWLRVHSAGESSLEAALRKLLNQVASDAAERIRDGVMAPGLLFDASAFDEKLLDTVRPYLLRSAGHGAMLEFKLHKPDRKASEPTVLTEIPRDVMARITESIGESLKQDYWQGIGTTTQRMLSDTISVGLDAGDSYAQMADDIEDRIGGDSDRALTIARTETTGALNAGHFSARSELIDEGLITGSEWLAMIDLFTRETHAELNGTTIGKDEQFDVGGYLAPYPGHWSLPAEERVHCRCATVASGSFADETDTEE